MSESCVVKQILHDKVDPNDLPIEALHASCLRMMTHFVQHPSPDLARAVIRMLTALGEHGGGFRPPSGVNVYQQAAFAWQAVLHDAFTAAPDGSRPPLVH